MNSFIFVILYFVVLSVSNDSSQFSDDDDDDDMDFDGMRDPVTYGSIIKLKHLSSGFYLHSHDINWGSGSGQQSVTAYPTLGDTNSMWQVFGSISGDWNDFKMGRPIECNNIIRLKHCNTKKWLHSHSSHTAPVSSQQEVSGYGDSDNHSDYGDEWIIKCLKKGKKQWIRGDNIALLHKQTNNYLFTSKKANFNNQNCRNCPINGQLEVSAVNKRLKGCKWKTHHGVYFRPIEEVEPFDDNENINKYSNNNNNNNNGQKSKTEL